MNKHGGHKLQERADLHQLQQFDLYLNKLSDPRPQEHGNLQQQQQHSDLYLNELSGPRPQARGNVQELQRLDLALDWCRGFRRSSVMCSICNKWIVI